MSRTRALLRLRPSVTKWRVREGGAWEGVGEDDEVRCREVSLVSDWAFWWAASSE